MFEIRHFTIENNISVCSYLATVYKLLFSLHICSQFPSPIPTQSAHSIHPVPMLHFRYNANKSFRLNANFPSLTHSLTFAQCLHILASSIVFWMQRDFLARTNPVNILEKQINYFHAPASQPPTFWSYPPTNPSSALTFLATQEQVLGFGRMKIRLGIWP